MRAAYRIGAMFCLLAAVVAASTSEFVTGELLGAVLIVACGVFCVANEVAAIREHFVPPPAPKQVARPQLKPPRDL